MSGGGFAHRGPPLLAARTTASAGSLGDSSLNPFHVGEGADLLSDSHSRESSSAAAASSVGGGATRGPESRSGGRPKRTLIESACAACRRRKSRCDGIRPACSRCQTLRTECAYEAEEGESRWSALRRRNQMLENERTELRELLTFIQTRPENQAQEIFNRLRTGGYDDVFVLLRQVKDGEVSANVNRSSTPNHAILNVQHTDQRLPPIRTMFDVSGLTHIGPTSTIPSHPPPPALLTPEHSRGSTSSGASTEYVPGRPPL